jgi:hypothetical protein
MTITFDNDNNVIVYALEKVISYARRTQQIFVAQCIWWLTSIIGPPQGLINHIDNVQSRAEHADIADALPEDASSAATNTNTGVTQSSLGLSKRILGQRGVSTMPRDLQEDSRL